MPVCPEPNPVVLAVNRESRWRALEHYIVLHEGMTLQQALGTWDHENLGLPNNDPDRGY